MVMFMGLLCFFVWLLIDSLAVTILFAILYGFCMGTLQDIQNLCRYWLIVIPGNLTALIASVVGQITPDEKLGARLGAFYSILAIGSLVGTPIGSALITNDETREGYRWQIVFSVTLLCSSKDISNKL